MYLVKPRFRCQQRMRNSEAHLGCPRAADSKGCDLGLLAGMMLFVLLSRASLDAQSISSADRPEVKVGDRWVYQDKDIRTGEKRETSFVVTAVEGDKIVTDTGLGTSGAWTFTRDWNLVERKTGETVEASMRPYWPHFQFPLKPDKTWDEAFENQVTTKSGKRNAKWQWKARVWAAEAITVPAGTFQALKIKYDGTFASREGRRSWSGSHKETIWYAPEAKRAIKREFEQLVPENNYNDHHVIELVSFKLVQ
jgi:hypothetical protein